jgi:hypothetical protein
MFRQPATFYTSCGVTISDAVENAQICVHCTRSEVNNCHTVSMTGLFDKQEGCEGGVDVDTE